MTTTTPQTARIGDWLETASGRQAWPLDPRPDDIDLGDIAHALARVCRFTGHCREFYSVAEHSLRVSCIVPPEHAAWALLHDASEAYLCDIPRPLKHLPEFAAYREAEKRLERVIADHFGLPWPMPPEVKHADNVLLATEARDLMPQAHPWEALPPPLPAPIRPMRCDDAERIFLSRAADLGLCNQSASRASAQEPEQEYWRVRFFEADQTFQAWIVDGAGNWVRGWMRGCVTPAEAEENGRASGLQEWHPAPAAPEHVAAGPFDETAKLTGPKRWRTAPPPPPLTCPFCRDVLDGDAPNPESLREWWGAGHHVCGYEARAQGEPPAPSERP